MSQLPGNATSVVSQAKPQVNMSSSARMVHPVLHVVDCSCVRRTIIRPISSAHCNRSRHHLLCNDKLFVELRIVRSELDTIGRFNDMQQIALADPQLFQQFFWQDNDGGATNRRYFSE